jgi:hypothetical protein
MPDPSKRGKFGRETIELRSQHDSTESINFDLGEGIPFLRS